MPRISCCMAVYNAERYLLEAVQSILDQSFSDFELVAVNDGSNDASVAILKSLADRDRRIRVISHENRGISNVRNELLHEASCELIAWMDSDDVALPERFARQLTYMDDHPECVVLGAKAMLVDPDGDALTELECLESHEEIEAWHLAPNSSAAIVNPSCMLRRSVAIAAGGYRTGFEGSEDYDLFLRMAERGRLANLPEMLLRYRQHLKSLSHDTYEKQRMAAFRALKETMERRGLPVPGDLIPAIPPSQSEAGTYLKWAWWALGIGNVRTARKYALKATIRQPWHVESLKALYCAVRGR
ncbi:MAG: hypothetical protein AMXMBFR84_36470 [Candidatus Hydrogenedentota bacterium]